MYTLEISETACSSPYEREFAVVLPSGYEICVICTAGNDDDEIYPHDMEIKMMANNGRLVGAFAFLAAIIRDLYEEIISSEYVEAVCPIYI